MLFVSYNLHDVYWGVLQGLLLFQPQTLGRDVYQWDLFRIKNSKGWKKVDRKYLISRSGYSDLQRVEEKDEGWGLNTSCMGQALSKPCCSHCPDIGTVVITRLSEMQIAVIAYWSESFCFHPPPSICNFIRNHCESSVPCVPFYGVYPIHSHTSTTICSEMVSWNLAGDLNNSYSLDTMQCVCISATLQLPRVEGIMAFQQSGSTGLNLCIMNGEQGEAGTRRSGKSEL